MEFGSTIAILFASSAITAASPPPPPRADPAPKAGERGVEQPPRTAPAAAPRLKKIP